MDICRICLISDAPKNICEIQTIKRKKKNLVDIISFCLNIQVTEDSKVSKNLCIKCYTKILNFHNFKELALKNDAYLKCLANGVDVKRENVKDEVKTEEIVNNNNVTVDSLNTRECIVLVDRTAVKLEPKTKDDDDDDPDYIPDEADFGSDNEFLSVIKKIKYEYMPENAKEGEAIQIGTITKKRKRKLKSERIAEVCDICGKAVKDMKTHKLFHNKPLSDRKNYKCDLCDKTYSSHTARYRHKRVKHLGMKKICPICNKAVSNLRYHKMMIHDYETMPFQCASCSHRFITASKLEEHMTIHTKDKPFECSVCGQKFRLKVVMEQHRRNIHENERTHLCQFCSKSFFKKYHLLVHLRMHTNERPYECPECGRRFGSCTTLKNHRLTHTDLKSFECHYCDAKFQRRSYLHVHLRTHTKEKRHGCKYCGLMFGRSDHRRRHEYTAHEKHTLAAPAPAPAQVGC